MVDHHNVNVYYMSKKYPWSIRFLCLGIIGFGGYLDWQYLKMCGREDDQFFEKSFMFGDWRARLAKSRPAADPEVLKE
jgi:hypothetical protein